jgi:hypothetical protein
VDLKNDPGADRVVSLIESNGTANGEYTSIQGRDKQTQYDSVGSIEREYGLVVQALNSTGGKLATDVDLGMVSRLGVGIPPALVWPDKCHQCDEHVQLLYNQWDCRCLVKRRQLVSAATCQQFTFVYVRQCTQSTTSPTEKRLT